MQVTAVNKNVPFNVANSWLKDSFKTYSVAKLYFSLFSIVAIVISVIPVIGAFMLPILMAKYAAMASEIEKNADIAFVEFFDGLFTKKAIVILGVFHLGFYLIAIIIKFILSDSNATPTTVENIIEIAFILITILGILMFILAFWLAPIICLKNSGVTAS